MEDTCLCWWGHFRVRLLHWISANLKEIPEFLDSTFKKVPTLFRTFFYEWNRRRNLPTIASSWSTHLQGPSPFMPIPKRQPVSRLRNISSLLPASPTSGSRNACLYGLWLRDAELGMYTGSGSWVDLPKWIRPLIGPHIWISCLQKSWDSLVEQI